MITSPWGIAGPKGMDPKIVDIIHDAFKKAIEAPAVLETLERYEMTPDYMNQADYKKFVAEQIKAEKALVDRLGMGLKE